MTSTTHQREPRYASLQRAAEYLDCREVTVRRMVARGELRRYDVGRVIRVDLNEVDALVSGGARSA